MNLGFLKNHQRLGQRVRNVKYLLSRVVLLDVKLLKLRDLPVCLTPKTPAKSCFGEAARASSLPGGESWGKGLQRW